MMDSIPSEPLPAPPGPPLPPAPAASRWLRWGVVAAIALALLAGAVGVWFWQRNRAPEPPTLDLADADPEVAEAIEAARREVVQSPRSGAAWGRLGMVLRAHDFGEEANRCFHQAEQLEPLQPRWPYLHALTLLLTDPEAGITLLQRAVELCGNSPPVPRLKLAEALLAQGRLDEAEAHFRQALAHDPASARAHLGLARLAYQRDDLTACREHLRFCADHPAARKATRLLLAEVYHRLDNQEKLRQLGPADALQEDANWPDPFVEEVVRLQVGTQARIAQADRLLWEGHGEEAVRLLQQTATRHPDADQVRLALGRTLVRMKDYPAAEAALREAVRLAPDSVEGHFQLGVALFFQGKPDAAETCFRKAVELKPDHALAHFNLGHCRKLQGDRTGAAAAFREALRCKPDFKPAQEALESVQQP